MAYGTVKVDNVTFTYNAADETTTFSGFYASTTNNLTLSGTASAATFTGTTANFTNVNAQNISVTTALSGLAITGGTAGFTTVTGTTVTGTTANFVSGVFSTQVSGVTITGTTVAATTGNFTSLTGTTTTGTTANFASGVFTTQVSGVTVIATTGTFTSLTGTTTNGTTASFTTGNFTSLTGTTTTGTTANFASGVFTTQVSGLLITGPTVSATTGTFTSLTGTTTTGTTANFVSGVFSTQISGVTITGTTVSTTTGNFISLTGTTATITSGIIASGTAALPSLAILSDSDTGIYSPGADQLAISTNGTGRLFVDASGNVGINTASTIAPGGFGYAREFALTGATSGDSSVAINIRGSRTVSGGFGDINFWHQSTSNRAYIQARRGSSDSAIDLDFITSGGAGMRITSAGLVGIGTSSPLAALDVRGNVYMTGNGTSRQTTAVVNTGGSLETGVESSAGAAVFTGSTAYASVIGSQNSTPLQFGTNGVIRATLDSSGRLGIGTTTPVSILDVTVGASGTRKFVANYDDSIITIKGANDSSNPENLRLVADNLRFSTGTSGSGSERARIDTSGRLLVGTSTSIAADDSKLQVLVTRADSLGGISLTNNQWYGNGTRILFQNAINSAGTITPVAAITGEGDGENKGRLVFSTTADGASSPTERMRITSGGVLLAGTTSGNAHSFRVSATEGTHNITDGVGFSVYSGTGGAPNAAATNIIVYRNSATSRSINAGGTINASGADYAEYMVKAGDFTIAKGAVCGVSADGLLTLDYADAVSFVIKSTNPSYVGNDTWGNEDAVGPKPDAQDVDALAQWEADLEAVRQKVDRIAFAGQVPVNVMGATPGQYIVPVEAADGGIEGIAKNEADLTLAEYMRAVGKVIAIEDDGRARLIVKVA